MPSDIYPCSECGFKLGEFSALRSLKLHGRIVCPDCAQKANPVYQEWWNSSEGERYRATLQGATV